MPVTESEDNSTPISSRVVNNSAQGNLRRREPVGVDMVRDLSLCKSVWFRPAAERGTYRSSSCVNCGLVALPKRVCSEVQLSVIGRLFSAPTRFIRLNRVNFGDAAITMTISRL